MSRGQMGQLMESLKGERDVTVDNFTDNTTDTTALSIQTDWNLSDNHFLIVGYEFAYDKLKAESLSGIQIPVIKKAQRPTMLVPVGNDYDGNQMRHAMFAAMESTFAEDWVANYGVRYTWVKSEMEINKSPMTLSVMGKPLPMTIRGSSTSVDNSEGKAVFNAGLSYNGFDNLSLRANYSQGYRAPILQELFIDSLMGGRFTYANPNLKPETTDNFEIGARYQNSGLMVDAAVFYSEAENYITAVQFGNPNTPMFHYDNIAKAKTLGFEMTSSLRMGDFEPYTSVTLLSREYEQNGDSSKKTGTPKASARIGVRYFTTAMEADWNADLYAVTQTKSEEYDFKNKTTSSYAGFTTFNLTGGVAFGPDKAYRLDAGIYNIGDKLYRYNGGKMDDFVRTVYEPGRHAAVKFTATF